MVGIEGVKALDFKKFAFKASPSLVLVSLDLVNKSSPDGFEWVHPTPCSWYIDS
jgi:hypothetical protein